MNARKSSFAGDVLKLVTGTASAQVIGVLAAPLIARMFSPSAFGSLALFAAVTGTISVVACCRYELAILIPEKDEEASEVAWLSMGFVLAVSVGTFAVLTLAGHRFWSWVNAPALAANTWLIAANVFLAGTYAVLTSWNMRKRAFGRLTILEVINRISISGSQIAIGFAGFANANTLIATTVLGTFAATALLTIATWHNDSHILLAGLRWTRIVQSLKRYAQFPKFSVGAILLNAVSGHMPAVLLSGFFSVGVAGEYSLSNRLLRVPGKLIGTSFSQAFFPRAAEARLDGTLGQSVEAGLAYLIKLTVFPCLLLAVIGKDLFVVVLGSRWAEAGVYAQIMSLWLFAWFIASPLTPVLVVLEKQMLELRFQAIGFAARCVPLLIGGFLHSARLGIGLFSVCGMLVYIAYSITVMKKCGARPMTVLKPILSSFALFLPAGLITVLVRYLSGSALMGLVAATVLLTAYFSNLLFVDPAARRFLAQLRRKLAPASANS